MTTSKTTTAVVKSQEKSPWTQEQVKLITSTVAKGATPDELKLFLYTASRSGLDPLTRQIHFVKRGGQMTIQTGIDGYRAIAERSGELAGIDDVVYDREDTPHPNKATVTIFRVINNTRVPFTASARWNEYAPTGTQAFMWNKMPYLMLGKCAEALALRKAFPNDLSDIYTTEEMSNLSDEPLKEVAKITPKPAPVAVDGEVVPESATAAPAPSNEVECINCAKLITVAERGFSTKRFGKALCRDCQKEAKV